MAYWLMKSEPDVYSFKDLQRDKRTSWNGVRNYQANNNMKAMKIDDEAFFYHSNEDKAVMGIIKIVKLWYPDPDDESGRFGMVDVAAVRELAAPITLAAIKADKALKDMALIRQGRLSISPVTKSEWTRLLEYA